MLKTSELEYTALPLLLSIGKKAKTAAELRNEYKVSWTTMSRWLRGLQDAGLAVQRWDKRWQPIVFLRVEQSPDIKDGIVVAGPPAEQVIKPTEEPPPPKDHKTPLPTRLPISDRAKKIAEQLKIPMWIRNMGEPAIGVGARCTKCSRATPLKYGGTAICPVCARR